MAKLALSYHRSTSTLNVAAHPATFKKWWREVCQSWVTGGAAKCCNEPRRRSGVYVIDSYDKSIVGEQAVEAIFAHAPTYTSRVPSATTVAMSWLDQGAGQC